MTIAPSAMQYVYIMNTALSYGLAVACVYAEIFKPDQLVHPPGPNDFRGLGKKTDIAFLKCSV